MAHYVVSHTTVQFCIFDVSRRLRWSMSMTLTFMSWGDAVLQTVNVASNHHDNAGHFSRLLTLLLSPEWRAEELGQCAVMVITSSCPLTASTYIKHTHSPDPSAPPTSFSYTTLFTTCTFISSSLRTYMSSRFSDITAEYFEGFSKFISSQYNSWGLVYNSTTYIFYCIWISWPFLWQCSSSSQFPPFWCLDMLKHCKLVSALRWLLLLHCFHVVGKQC